MLKTWSIVAIAIVTALLLMWGILAYQSKENRTERRDYGSTEDSHSRFSGQGGQREITGLYRRQEPQAIMRFSEQGRRELGQGQSYGSDGVLTDDRIRKALTRSLGASTGTATAEEADLLKMFESTKQDNQSVREAFKKLLENISETDQTRNESLNKLARQVSNLSFQVQDFKIQNKALIEQLQALEMQVSKLKR